LGAGVIVDADAECFFVHGNLLGSGVGGKTPCAVRREMWGVAGNRGGSVRLNRVSSFLSGVSACFYAACLTVGNITVYASSGVFLSNFECGLDRLYQFRYCMIDLRATLTES